MSIKFHIFSSVIFFVACIVCFIQFRESSAQFDIDTISGKAVGTIELQQNISDCYKQGKPVMCLSKFWNLAYGRLPEATNTCGEDKKERFCVQTSIQASAIQDRYCFYCYKHDERHTPQFLTDFNKEGPWKTFWQSQTLFETALRSSKFNVNITIDFGIQTQVTYVRVLFQSPRPESMAIYRKKTASSDWEPWAYFSKNCKKQYNLNEEPPTASKPVCRSGFSDMVPLSGGNVLFPTLYERVDEGDKNAFWNDPKLQDWVLASKIRISLDRLNTHGDTYSGSDVLYRYYYAITDIAVGGRCQCNGHASVCHASEDTKERYCSCQHNTEGKQCERCRPDYNDRPWRQAIQENAWECRRCNCSGNSEECKFDNQLYIQSGNVSGGRCINCQGNTEGPHCEVCKPNYRRPTPGAQVCIECHCHPEGSKHGQCDDSGQCRCKEGVTGEKCDRCKKGYFNLTNAGCQSCNCLPEGTKNNAGECNAITGKCECKANVIGIQCRKCKAEYFGLHRSDSEGCQKCFCYGHSNECSVRSDLKDDQIKETLNDINKMPWGFTIIQLNNTKRLRGEYPDKPEIPVTGKSNTSVFPVSYVAGQPPEIPHDVVYIDLPEKFLGDQSNSFNKYLRLELSLSSSAPVLDGTTPFDVELISGHKSFTTEFYNKEMKNPTLNTNRQVFVYRLTHDPSNTTWLRKSDSPDIFRNILSNLSSIRIRASFNAPGGAVMLRLFSVALDTTSVDGSGVSSVNMHNCTCPEGHEGPFCQRCKPGYKREFTNGGPYVKCIPCQCYGHSDVCDSATGQCGYPCQGNNCRTGILLPDSKLIRKCSHNTMGKFCQDCAPGYYGNASLGNDNDCKKCPCPDGALCHWDPKTAKSICTKCPVGTAGASCELCAAGYWRNQTSNACVPCMCNNNTDPNDIQVCHPDNGGCLKCIDHTGGRSCEICKNGYFGDALVVGRAKCATCGCDSDGTETSESCDHKTGKCKCKKDVIGRQCDRCQDGFFNITSGIGCEPCACNYTGTGKSATCHKDTGACSCLQGVTGLKCNRCKDGFFNFSSTGCEPCNCSPLGILSGDIGKCNATGHCQCKPYVEGRKCNRCQENRFNVAIGCQECPPCYGAVQQFVNNLRNELKGIENLFKQTSNISSGAALADRLKRARDKVQNLHNQVTKTLGSDLSGSNDKVMKRLEDQLAQTRDNMDLARSNLTNLRTYVSTVYPQEAGQILKLATEIQTTLVPVRQQLDNIRKTLDNYKSLSNRISNVNNNLDLKMNEMKVSVERFQKETDNLRKQSNDAFKKAEKADKDGREFPAVLNDLQNKTGNLLKEMENIEDMNKEAEQMVLYATSNSTFFNQEYIRLVGILDPFNLDFASLNKSLKDLNETNNVVTKQYSDLMLRYSQIKANLTKIMSEAKKIYDSQVLRQTETDNFMKELTENYNRMKEIVDKCDQLYNNATKLLALLSDYDKAIKTSKKDAEDAMKRVPDIQRRMKETTEASKQADLLYQKHNSAVRDIVGKTDQTATITGKVLNVSKDIRREAMEAYGQIEEHDKVIKKAGEDLKNLNEKLLKIINEQNTVDEDLSQLAQNSTKAKIDAETLKNNVDGLTNKLRQLINIQVNSSFDSVVADIEKKLNQLEKEVNGTAPDNNAIGQVSGIKSEVDRYWQEQDELEKELEWISAEHNRLTKLIAELPDRTDCWFTMKNSLT